MNQFKTLAVLHTLRLAFVVAFMSSSVIAQTVWTGAADFDYFNESNWSNGLPEIGNDAVIPGGASLEVNSTLNIDYSLSSFGTILANAVINVRATGTLSSSRLLTTNSRINNFGTFENFGDLEIGLNGSMLTHPNGTTRSNGSILNQGWIGSTGRFVNDGSIDVTADGVLAVYETGSLANAGVLNISGIYNHRNGGKYSSPSGGTINVEATGRLNNNTGATIQNAGIINVETGGIFFQRARLINFPGRIFVDGKLQIDNAAAVTLSNFLTINDGGVLIATASDTFQIQFSLVNNGRTSIRVPVQVGGLITNGATGNFNVNATGELDFIAGTNLNNTGTFTTDGVIRTVGTLTNDGTFTNTGTMIQNNGGSIINNSLFTNEALIQNVNRIVNNDRFVNRSRLTNDSGGTIENNAELTNELNAHIENLFQIYNKANLINRGYFENGVSLFNEAMFNNYGFLSNVGDIFNNPAGTFNVYVGAVIDNSGAGIFTNQGILNNQGEINNFNCGIFDNKGTINNDSWITNEGIFYQNGVLNNKAIMGNGPVVVEGGTSPLICQPWTQKLDQNGSTRVSGTRFAAPRFDSCSALQYLIDGEEFMDFTCADLGVHQITFTLVDRRGNRINCGTTLTITDNFAPRIDSCPVDIMLTDVVTTPVAATWDVPSFVDNCDTDIDVVASHQPGDLFPEGSTVVTYTATDDAGNEFICEFTVTVTVKIPDVCTPKNADGLLAYYNLINGSSIHVTDRAGYGEPLHMRIIDQNAIRWENGCGLKNTGNGIVQSWAGANGVGNSIMMTNAMTLEAWVKPSRIDQSGPARIVTYSENTSYRNFTLGQVGDKYVFRLKTTHTNSNGMPDRVSSAGVVKVGKEQHIVFTRSADGQERLYVDGEIVYSGKVDGNLSNWGTHCKIAFFNEQTRDRAWKGTINKVAIYDRAWSPSEIVANRAVGACSTCDDSPRGNVCKGPRGQVSYERYDNIGGHDLSWLYKNAKFPASPDVNQKLTSLSIPSQAGENYGSRTRGWIYPAKTGDYQLAVSGDDYTTLLFSTVPDNASGAYKVAYLRGWTNPGDLHKYSTQKSNVFHLQEGKGYYFELLHKEGVGGDHASVYWKVPGSSSFKLIDGNNIGDIESCGNGGNNPEECFAQKGGLLREVWNNVETSDLWALFSDPRYPNNADSRSLIQAYCGPINVGDYYATRVRGYIHPDVTGDYKFTVTGDDQTKLLLSTDATEANAVVIAEVNGWTNTTEFHKYPSQKSISIRLEAGKRYYTELLHKEGHGGDFFNVFWQTPTNSSRVIVPGTHLSPYVECDDNAQPEVCNTSVLFVVGNTWLNNGDAAIKSRLEYLGYDVMIKDAYWANADMAADKGLVIISSTVNSSHIGSKFRDVAVPVLTWESYLYDDMRMTKSTAGSDYGSSFNYYLNVINGTDQLAAGKSGNQSVLRYNANLAYGKVMNSDARIIAHAPADPWMASVFAYDRGDQMAGGMKAPAIRIGFYLDNNAACHWTSYGRDLFDAAVRYATNCTGNETARRSSDVLTLEASQLTSSVELNWTSNTAFKNEYFLVERSADDINFSVIAEVEATGSGNEMINFSYVDEAPEMGENFYRITAIYSTGEDNHSELRKVDFADLGQIALYPNPARDQVTLSLKGFENRDLEIQVTDALGRTLSTRNLNGNEGQLTLDVSDLPAGWYGVTLQSGSYRTTQKLMVTRD